MFLEVVTGKLKSYGVAIEYKMHNKKQREMPICKEKLRKNKPRLLPAKKRERRKQRKRWTAFQFHKSPASSISYPRFL